MEYIFKINVETSGIYGIGNNGDWDVETEEIDVEIDWDDFRKNKDVKEMYANEFCGKFNISLNSAYDILNEYDLWFEDDEMTQSILDNCVDDLKEVFKKEVEETIEYHFSKNNEDY